MAESPSRADFGRMRRSSLRNILGLLLRHRKALAVGIVALIGVDGLQLIIPKIMQYAVDALARGMATPRQLWLAGAAIVLVSLGMGICRFGWRFFIIGSSHRIERDLRQDLYDHLQSLSPQYYDKTRVGDLMAHATNDLQAVRMATGMAALASIDAIILAAASISIMVTMDLRLTLLTLIPLPLLSLMMLRFGKLVHSRFTAVQEAFSRLTDKAQESMSGVRVVKAYGDEISEESYFSEKANDCVVENVRLVRIWGLFGPIIGALAMASTAILLGAGGRMVIYGEVSLGEFVAFSSYLGMLIWPMMAVGWVVNILQRGTASMDRLEKIFATPPDIAGGQVCDIRTPSIEVRNLTFRYPQTDVDVLADASFTLEANAMLGIVGRTGSGKTTLVELLMRLYDPPRGTVFVGGREISELELDHLRRMFGYVPQETFLFAMSIADNIAFGAESVSRERIEELAGLVEIASEIREFPDGFDTLVGERGVTLSGGQKQRVAIARALAADPRILILDDALSSVDTETEAAILSRLRTEMSGRTSIVIAHRISTVMGADLILVFDNGRIVEQGTHRELLSNEGFYSELYRMQRLEEEAMKTGDDGKGEVP
ncbi:ABC transporter ATP-binding protein [Candidatus Fermentibacterales bacterium]|nr:ABC transporter ATP-binding protein [Candidatus Fermentibacterales bacterium]